ncbi:hypothetical protein LQ772_08140 [Frateuria edaphi]|uniref:hypothetical protein n=1 Tax=Frateuria edaphi TaxID=2898793 RepID=UPI001E57170D|nr:hypothetical protein [Frateuria edaphi]UGB47239.1 hypothetical protein LQ772_08140 [Frateuria edaphi]
MNLSPQGRWARLVVLGLCSFGCVLHAQSVTPEGEYKKLIRVSEDLQPLGENPFGENISLYSGSLSFEQTDVSLSGNGPTLSLSRRFDLPAQKDHTNLLDSAFGNWDIDLPRITTMTANQQNVTGWMVASPNPLAICSQFDAPPTVDPPIGDSARRPWSPSQWWHGYQLVIPGQGSQDLLERTAENPVAPQIGGLSFPIVTKQNWAIGCPGPAENDSTREAFLAVAPDGTKYTFAHLAYRWAPNMDRQLDSVLMPDALVAGEMHPMLAPSDFLLRREASMLVTRIEDRFHNSITYSYDRYDRLTSITASDGRELSVQYTDETPLIRSVTLQPKGDRPRTWVYSYAHLPDDRASAVELTSVDLPDGKGHWTFNLSDLTNKAWVDTEETYSNCDSIATPHNLGTSYTGTITHPSGLTGSFTVTPVKRGRSYVYRECWIGEAGIPITPTSPSTFALTPNAWNSMSITARQYTGAGIPSGRTWSYSYSSSNESWTQDSCAAAGTCTTTVWTDETAPDRTRTRQTFSNRYDETESRLIRTDRYDKDGFLVQSVINTYSPSDAGPWPARLGRNPQAYINQAQTTRLTPLTKRIIAQDQDTYTWEADAFDALAQATKVQRYSATAGRCAIAEQTTYLNDTTNWVLGLPAKVSRLPAQVAGMPSCGTTSEVVDEYRYSTPDDTLAERWHFGQLVMSYAFYSSADPNAQLRGQLKSFTDGNSHTTTLSGYMRGVPQAISYPDLRSQSLVVDEFGQITSITDQAEATTSYRYDDVGRLTRIDYPGGDERAWYPKTFSYAPVSGDVLSSLHWKRTVSKGNQLQVTHFNAMLQPVLVDTSIAGADDSHISQRKDYDYRGRTVFSSYSVPGTPDLASITAGFRSYYDVLGRVTETDQTAQGGLLKTLSAYEPGASTAVTDPRNKVTTTTFQVFDEPSNERPIKVEAPTGLVQTIARDQYGNPLWINQAGPYGTGTVSLTKTLTYDSYHRLCRTTEPESGSEVMAYDGANNLWWSAAGLSLTGSGCGLEQVADAGKTVRHYDEMNRVLVVDAPEGTQDTTYHYDPLGNPDSAISGISTWSAKRNKLGQLVSETLQVTGQDAWKIGYAHDAYGNLQSLTYPDGTVVNYAPDALGRATQVDAYATGVHYYPNGEVQAFTLGNNTLYSADQNARQLLSNFTYERNASTWDISQELTYDPNGNITHVEDFVDGRRTKDFHYDDLNRLDSATASNLWGTETYSYDPLNNIRSKVGTGTATYNYDSTNRLVSITGAINSSFGYDNRGNVASKNGTTLQFDQKNQLLQIDGIASYAYEAAGRRVMKTTAGGTSTFYFYSQAGQLLHQYDAASNQATSYIYLGNKLIAKDTILLTIPDPPASISAPASAGTSYRVSWSESANAAAYVLEQSKDGGVTWSFIYKGSTTGLTFYPTANGSYQYRVKASNVKGYSAYAVSGVVEVTLPPTAAPTVTAPPTNSTGNYTVTWNAVAAATSYAVDKQLNGGTWMRAQDGSALSLAVSDAGNGTYHYRVRGENKGGPGPWSTIAETVVGRIPVAPAAPHISISGNDWKPVFAVSWGSVPWATRYVAEMVGEDTVVIYDGPNTSASIMVLDEGMVQFHVKACSNYGCSPWSPYTTHGGSAPTSAPTISVPTSSSTGSYTVSWTAVSAASSYKLQEQVNGSTTWTSITNTTGTSFALSGKANGTYGYRVMACNANGCGPVSAAKSVTVGVVPATPAAPHVSVSGVDWKQTLTVSWTAVSRATSYQVNVVEPGATTGDINDNGSSTTFSMLAFDGGTWKFRVRACNSVGCSGWSAYGSGTVAPSL